MMKFITGIPDHSEKKLMKFSRECVCVCVCVCVRERQRERENPQLTLEQHTS